MSRWGPDSDVPDVISLHTCTCPDEGTYVDWWRQGRDWCTLQPSSTNYCQSWENFLMTYNIDLCYGPSAMELQWGFWGPCQPHNRQAQTSESLVTNLAKFLGNMWFKIKTFNACTQRWASRTWCTVGAMCSGLIDLSTLFSPVRGGLHPELFPHTSVNLMYCATFHMCLSPGSKLHLMNHRKTWPQ